MCAMALLTHTPRLSGLFHGPTCDMFILAFFPSSLSPERHCQACTFPEKGMSNRTDPCLIKPHMFFSPASSSSSFPFFLLWVPVRDSGRGENKREKERTCPSTVRSISRSSNSHCSLLPICFYFQELHRTMVLARPSGARLKSKHSR